MPFLLVACAGTISGPSGDASADQSLSDATPSDGSVRQDGASDSGSADSTIAFEAGSLDQCDPNVSLSCPEGKKCCSEPTHQNPPTAYVCVTPSGGGLCPQQP
ncbi:hypothetical protein BH09MYX1_BH09MYX1_03040 [soil metagenome]